MATVAPPRRLSLLTRQDKIVLALMLGIPTARPSVPGVVSSHRLDRAVVHALEWRGRAVHDRADRPEELHRHLFPIYPPFWPALSTTSSGWPVLILIATPFGIFLAVLLDREIRGLRFYQSVFFLPVVLSLALIGFIWSCVRTRQGLVNNLLGTTSPESLIDWLGNPRMNLWAVLLLRAGATLATS